MLLEVLQATIQIRERKKKGQILIPCTKPREKIDNRMHHKANSKVPNTTRSSNKGICCLQ